ncbi:MULTISPECIES: SURF1 family protein [Methylomonas]|uniref:SURF1 family protein n=1 Tax=Methylomonas TaxID=416 RepID=UPI00123296F4|nr:SURF1 family protein [Methylomonas rhizoryzae]
MQLNLFGHSFSIKWPGLLLYLALSVVLCRLGFWQLDRAEQKRQLQQHLMAAQELSPLSFSELTHSEPERIRYRQAVVRGRYDFAHQFLLDNQIHNGKPGYFVLTPLIIADCDCAVLVNRGWLALPDGNRNSLPQISVSQNDRTVRARVNRFPGVGYKLAGAETPSATWPSVLQLVDAEVLTNTLGYRLLPFQLELSADDSDGYLRVWKTVNDMPPEKHIGYAVQWFILALTLTALYLWTIFRQRSG